MRDYHASYETPLSEMLDIFLCAIYCIVVAFAVTFVTGNFWYGFFTFIACFWMLCWH